MDHGDERAIRQPSVVLQSYSDLRRRQTAPHLPRCCSRKPIKQPMVDSCPRSVRNHPQYMSDSDLILNEREIVRKIRYKNGGKNCHKGSMTKKRKMLTTHILTRSSWSCPWRYPDSLEVTSAKHPFPVTIRLSPRLRVPFLIQCPNEVANGVLQCWRIRSQDHGL